jgi:hypothetical protein
MLAEALVVQTDLVKAPMDPEPVPEVVEVPEAYGYEDGHEADLYIIKIVTVVAVPITDPEGPILVPTVPVPVVGECWGDGHGYYGQDGHSQEHDSTHKLPPFPLACSWLINAWVPERRILLKEDFRRPIVWFCGRAHHNHKM